MSDLMRKKKCRHGLIDPELDVHQEHPEWAACMGFGLVPVEPVGTLTSTTGSTGRITYDIDGPVLPEGEYLLIPLEADDE